jgi:hypothetical protein
MASFYFKDCRPFYKPCYHPPSSSTVVAPEIILIDPPLARFKTYPLDHHEPDPLPAWVLRVGDTLKVAPSAPYGNPCSSDMESQASAPDIEPHARKPDRSVRKPRGEAGKPNSGKGYNLQEALELQYDASKYKAIQVNRASLSTFIEYLLRYIVEVC